MCIQYTCIYIYICVVPPPRKRPRVSYIHVELGRWGSQFQIDTWGLRVGFRVQGVGLRVKDLGSAAFQNVDRYIG